MAGLLDIINSILIKKNKILVDSLDQNKSFRIDFGFDSLDLAELTVKIEDKYGIDIFENGVIDKVSDVVKQLK